MIDETVDIDQATTSVISRLKMLNNLAPTIQDLDDTVIETFAKDAITQALSDGFSNTNIVLGATYLAAHFINTISQTGSNISEKTASVLTIKYFDRAGTDDYLLEYQRLKNSLSKNTIAFL